MKEKNNITFSLNINKDDSNLNDFLYCWQQFGQRPNKITIHSTYSTKLFQNFISDKIKDKNTFTEIIPEESGYIINDKMLVKLTDESYLSYIIIDKEMESSIVSDIVFYHKSESDLESIQDIIDGLNKCMVDFCEEESFNLNTISFGQNGLEIEPIATDFDLDNFDSYYHSKTSKSITKAVKKIKKNDKGLVILSGERGTGKTSTISYIADNLDRIVIFIPNNLIDQTINNSDFRKFLKKYYKPVLVLDDCEMIFNEFFTKSNMIVNNLLQIVDGFTYNDVTVVAIFNVEDSSEIDHSLLECNNLLEVVNFDYLESDEATDLSNLMKNSKKYKNKTKLIDVIKKKNQTDRKHIGF
jgi:hypothetical protein